MIRRVAAALSKPRPLVTSLLEVAGIGVIVSAVWRVSATAGLAAAGAALILIGVLAA